jgi:hypothetical protein
MVHNPIRATRLPMLPWGRPNSAYNLDTRAGLLGAHPHLMQNLLQPPPGQSVALRAPRHLVPIADPMATAYGGRPPAADPMGTARGGRPPTADPMSNQFSSPPVPPPPPGPAGPAIATPADKAEAGARLAQFAKNLGAMGPSLIAAGATTTEPSASGRYKAEAAQKYREAVEASKVTELARQQRGAISRMAVKLGMPPDTPAAMVMETMKAGTPASIIKEFTQAKAAGLLPPAMTYPEYLKERRAGTTINVGGKSEKWGDPPKDMVWARNPQGEVITKPDEKSGYSRPVAIPIFTQAEIERRRTVETTADLVLEDIGRAMDIATESPILTTGLGGLFLSKIAGTSAADLESLLVTIKSNIGFDRLQRMRQESPTGGALGNVSNLEVKTLQAVMGSLEQAQSDKQFIYNLRRLSNIYNDIVHGPNEGPKRYDLSKPDITDDITIKKINPTALGGG